MVSSLRVTVWNEYRHERQKPEIAAIYPQGIHGAIAGYLRGHGAIVHTATLDERQGRGGSRSHVLEVLRAAHDELQLLRTEAPDLASTEELASGETDGEVEDARSAHDRVVDVEERRARTGSVVVRGVADGLGGCTAGLAI